MTTALTRLAGSAFELTITVPWSEIKVIYDQVFLEIASEIEVEGFRKGKAPPEMLLQRVDKKAIYDEVIKRILPKAYSSALEEHHLKPIVNPQIHIASGEEDKDWQFIAKAAEKPTINLGDYKNQITTINAAGKIWKPGDTPVADTASDDATQKTADDAQNKKMNQIIDKLLEVCKVELPELLIESEVNRLMTQLVDDVRTAGLTYEQYLASKNVTSDQIRSQYRQQVETTLKLELILEAVADDLSVVVDEKEIEEIIAKEADAKKKEALSAQKYYLTSLLRREKTLTKLASL